MTFKSGEIAHFHLILLMGSMKNTLNQYIFGAARRRRARRSSESSSATRFTALGMPSHLLSLIFMAEATILHGFP